METGVGDGEDPEDIKKGLDPRVADSTIESYSGFRFTRLSEGVVDSRVRAAFVRGTVFISLLIGEFDVVSCLGLRNGSSSKTPS